MLFSTVKIVFDLYHCARTVSDSVGGAGYDWRSLSADNLVVDVGAGAGSASLALARACPDVNIILQDRPAVIEQGQEV